MALLDSAPSLANKVQRGKRMTKSRKVIGGVPLRLAHAGSSAALKSDPAGLALVDEYDEMLANIKGQGDPLGLVERRGDTYADFVCAVTSTCRRGMVKIVTDELSGLRFWDVAPADDLESPIWRLWQQGSRHHWTWPCPHCDEYFVPRFECVRWPEGATPIEAEHTAHLECPRCGGVIEEAHKADMNERGRYVAPGQTIAPDGVVSGDVVEATSISFWVSGLASPFVTFGERVRAYVEAFAIGDEAMVQTAINAGFGELYTPGGVGANDWRAYKRRRMPHKFGEVPIEVLRLTAAVDVQGNGFFYSIRGWGERASSWQIESGEIAGFTNEPEVWGDLSSVLLDAYGGLHIALCLIDSGFRVNKPNEGPANVVYEFARRFRRFVKPTKGYSTLSAPVMRGKAKMTVPGQRMPVQLELVRLDTDFWKQRLHERLAWPQDQAGGFLLAADASDDYLKQLASETRKLSPTGKPVWVAVSRRNHYLDCEAMNEAAGHMLAVQKIPLGAKRRIDDDFTEVIDVPEAETFEVTPAPQPPLVPAPNTELRKRMSGFASRFNNR